LNASNTTNDDRQRWASNVADHRAGSGLCWIADEGSPPK
jgi:hypothetical protein